jgi:Activator of Hsp90 ATPase homolog 1-like protein
MREPATKVAFTIEPYGNLVKLTVTHEGFVGGSKLLGAVSTGWPAILSGLKSMLETGKPLAIPRVALGKEELAKEELDR